MKNKKGIAGIFANKYFVIVLGIILIGLSLGFFRQASLINDVDGEKVYVSVISEDSQQQTLLISAGGGRITDIRDGVYSYNLNEGLPIASRGGDLTNTYPNQWSAGERDYGYLTHKDYYSTTTTTKDIVLGIPVGVSAENLTAECKIIFINDDLNKVQCYKITGILKVTNPNNNPRIEGITFAIKPTFYKAGYIPPAIIQYQTESPNQQQVVLPSDQTIQNKNIFQQIWDWLKSLIGI